jgi:WD40-like Beta Propeller Repeat
MNNLLLILLFAFSVNAQSVSVKTIEQMTQPEQGAFFHPVAGPNDAVLLTGAGFVGLYLLNGQDQIKTLSEAPGAGYEPAFSADGKNVYFKPYRYEGMKKLSSLVKKSISEDREKILIKDERHFTSAKRLPNGAVAVNKDAGLYVVDKSGPGPKNAVAPVSVFLEKGKMVLYKNGEKKTLTPLGDGFYLWPSISPDGTKLLFTKAGKGTFISTLEGDILVELGYANAPQWSPDGKWVVFMRDLDDGHQVLESDIFITSIDGKTTLAITETDDRKEVYPVWAADNEIIFGTEEGVIYKAILEK